MASAQTSATAAAAATAAGPLKPSVVPNAGYNSEGTTLHQDDETIPRSRDGLAFWNTHIAADQRTAVCPAYIAACDAADRAQLARYDDEYQALSWAEVKRTISENRLGDFTRWPSDLRAYRDYMKDITEQWGSVMKFILFKRLGWEDVSPRGRPFEFEDDYKVLRNDWPYGIDRRITHLVVWTKFGFDEDAATGDLTPAARRQIDDYVGRVFRKGDENGRANVQWFKNWAALKSIHSIEHFHVMLYNADQTLVHRVTSGDVPMSEKR